ncbi:MAG TPA: hypothetical protein VHR45_15495 [Thermoanaerobaculia bacterium]|nr:hypothetical protein [Thermoanaerobaculia bacterium]
MTKVATSSAGFTFAAEDHAKVAEATQHFRAAEEALARATEVCAKFRARVGKPDPSGFLDCDLAGFKHLSEILARIAVPKGGLPALEDVQAAVTAVHENVEFWQKSVQALRGLPGHYPVNPTPKP